MLQDQVGLGPYLQKAGSPFKTHLGIMDGEEGDPGNYKTIAKKPPSNGTHRDLVCSGGYKKQCMKQLCEDTHTREHL